MIRIKSGYGVFILASDFPTAIFEYELAAKEFIEFNMIEDCTIIKKINYSLH